MIPQYPWDREDRVQDGRFHDSSYQGSQIFEAVGISKEVIDRYFTDTVSRVGGVTLKDIAADVDAPSIRRPSIRWGYR